jgi:DNA-binding phage protein
VPTLLDGILERHEGPEPRVLTVDIQAILRARVLPGDDASGDSVTQIAEAAGVSARTVYRVLNPEEGKETLSLDLADKLAIAAQSHLALANVRLAWNGWPEAGGFITEYSVAFPEDPRV